MKRRLSARLKDLAKDIKGREDQERDCEAIRFQDEILIASVRRPIVQLGCVYYCSCVFVQAIRIVYQDFKR